MQQAPVQVTVVEYVNEFFKNYFRRAYGKSLAVNASKGAETLMGMLKLVLNRGGRDELRIALHCFKDQLTGAINSSASVRQQQVEEVFALLASLVDAAERLRQFSPVKEQLSSAVLEEVRFRLYRIIVGDGFCEDVALRRRALDLAFSSMMREAAEQERSRARLHKLSSTGSTTAVGNGALVLAALQSGSAAAGASAAGGHVSEAGAKGPGRLRGSLQRKAAALTGPDFSSWEGLWASLTSMSPRRMLPLLQVVMTDLYMGHLMPGTPGAAAAAAATAAAAASAQLAAANGCGAPSLMQQDVMLRGQLSEQRAGQRSDSAAEPGQVSCSMQQQQDPAPSSATGVSQPDTSAATASQPAALSPDSAAAAAAPSTSTIDSGGGTCPRCAVAGGSGTGAAAVIAAAADTRSSSARGDAGSRGGSCKEVAAEQPAAASCIFSSAGQSAPDDIGKTVSGDAQGQLEQHHQPQLQQPPDTMPQQVLAQQPQQQPQQPHRFGRSSARPAHPIAAGYGASLGSRTSTSNSPKLVSTPAESKGGLAGLASRLSGSGGGSGGGSKAASPASGSGSKWGIAGGFLGLQNSTGSGRLIPRGWVQFGNKTAVTSEAVATDSDADADADADAFAVGAAVDAKALQQQPDQVLCPPELTVPVKAASVTVAAGTASPTVAETSQQHDNGSGAADGFGGDEPDWSTTGSRFAVKSSASAAASTMPAAVHCTATPAAAVGL